MTMAEVSCKTVAVQNSSQWPCSTCPIPQLRLVGVRTSYIFFSLIFPEHPESGPHEKSLFGPSPQLHPVTIAVEGKDISVLLSYSFCCTKFQEAASNLNDKACHPETLECILNRNKPWSSLMRKLESFEDGVKVIAIISGNLTYHICQELNLQESCFLGNQAQRALTTPYSGKTKVKMSRATLGPKLHRGNNRAQIRTTTYFNFSNDLTDINNIRKIKYILNTFLNLDVLLAFCMNYVLQKSL